MASRQWAILQRIPTMVCWPTRFRSLHFWSQLRSRSFNAGIVYDAFGEILGALNVSALALSVPLFQRKILAIIFR